MTKDTNSLNKFFLYSLLIHAILIFGFSFKWYINRTHLSQNLDVTLISTKSKDKAENPDYLANNNNAGSGDSDTRNIPTNKYKAIFPDEEAKKIISPPDTPIAPENNADLTNKQDNAIKTTAASENKSLDDPTINDLTTQDSTNPDLNVQPQMESEVSSLINKIANRTKLFAQRPKKRFISAKTQEYRDAAYLEEWRTKIEYLGNKYYPEQAKERNLFGDVLLLVALRPDGSIEAVKIEKSSGYKILDEAAVQTVHLAAPFKPFPQEMRKDTDILEIVRTWRFSNDELTTN